MGERHRGCCGVGGGGERCPRPTGLARLRALAFLFLALLPMVSGCGNQVELNPALVPQQEDIDQGTAAGKALIAAGADPYQAFSRLMQDINIRVSADVVIRQAAVCWPRAEIAFEIAEQGDASDTGIQKAVTEALFRLRSELRFVVVVQIPDARDPASVGFEMRALSTSYPPVAVEKPVLIRAVSSALDPDMPPSSLWSYDVSFPISGSPGYPPIDTNTTFVTLVVKDGEAEGDITVTFPQRRTPTV